MSTAANPVQQFEDEKETNIKAVGNDSALLGSCWKFLEDSAKYNYTYNFQWLGRPIIQLPQDMVAMQELIWQVKPDLVIEMGIAHGGSLILSASMLAMLDYCEAVEKGEVLDPKASKRKVLGVDIDIRSHNREAIEQHPVSHLIDMIEGSSIEDDVIEQVKGYAEGYKNILVVLDSNHTHDHVLAELEAYAPLVSSGSYCIVFDTAIEDMPESMYQNRPWNKTDNPKTAVWEYLKTHPEFEIDKSIEHKLLLTVAPDGYLKRK